MAYTGVSIDDRTHGILDFGIGVYRESAASEETWQCLQALIVKMEQAGWIADDDRNKRNPVSQSAIELRDEYINFPGGAGGDQKYRYDDYGNEAWVRLVKTITSHAPGEELRFNMVLQIQVATHPKKKKAH